LRLAHAHRIDEPIIPRRSPARSSASLLKVEAGAERERPERDLPAGQREPHASTQVHGWHHAILHPVAAMWALSSVLAPARVGESSEPHQPAVAACSPLVSQTGHYSNHGIVPSCRRS